MRVLVIDDDAEALDLVSTCLRIEGFEVHTARSGAEGLQVARRWMPDLVVLDVRMPDVGGLEICRRLRSVSDVPVLLISAYATDIKDQIRGLDVGADDYLVKPLDFNLLRARVRALRRRSAKADWREQHPLYIDSHLVIDLRQPLVRVRGNPISLSALDYQLLVTLVLNAGQTVPVPEIIEALWGSAADIDAYTGYLYTYVRRLRKAIEPNPDQPIYIVNERGLGYRFDPQEW